MNDLLALLGDINSQVDNGIIDDGFIEFSGATKTDFVPDILPAEITLRGYQVAAVETILKFKRGILGFAPGMGKRLAEGTPILTPNGWVGIETLNIGDLVIGRDGMSHPVIGTFYEENRPLYRVTFQDDTWLDADDEHVWTAKLYSNGKWKDVTTEEILNHGLRDSNGKRKWRIPMVSPVDGFNSQSLNDDPYILGVVAGDGNAEWTYSSGETRWSVCTDREILEAIGATNITNHETSLYTAYGDVTVSDLIPATSAFKNIPKNYLLGSISERLALLQGLLDTDGSPIETGGVEFCSTSTNLIDVVCELTRSLGGIVNNRFQASSKFNYNGEEKIGLAAERVNIKLPANMPPFRLKRKLDLWIPPTKYDPVKIIDSIERIENGAGYCIAIDSPDHLYVAKGYIVTHNTPTALTAVANLGDKTVIVIPPSLAYDPWSKEIERCFPGIEYEILTGQTPWSIDYGTQVVIVGDSVVSFWADAIKEWGPKVLVVDEAQRHKNFKAKRANATSEIASYVRDNDGAVILLTGTLATNDAEEVWMPAQIAGIAKSIVGSSSRNKWNHKWCFMQQMAVEKKVGPKKEDKKQIWIDVPNGCKDPIGLHQALRETAYIRVERDEVVDMPEKLIVEHAMALSPAGFKEYKKIRSDFETWLIEQGKDPEAIAGSEKLVQLGKLVEFAALAKIESSAEYVAALVEQQEQVVVMAHHKSVVAAFKAELDRLKITNVTFTGSDSPQAKADHIDAFKSGEVSVLIGNISSAGTGLNLENSANLVFIQLPWSPAEFEQASDRIYRVTQTRTCTIHVLYSQGTVEDHVMEVLSKKAVITDGINAGTGEAAETESFVDEVWEMMV